MRRLCALAMSLSLSMVLILGAQAEDALERVKKKGVLVAGVTDDAPPFSFLERSSGKILGYDVDLATAIAKRLGVKIELRPAPVSANRLSELMDGSIDLLAAGLTHSQSHARESIIDLSEHYVGTGQRFLAKRGTVKSHEDLKGKRIGAVAGMPSETCARDRCQGATVIPFDDYEEGLQALRKGAIDVFTSDQVILLDLLGSLPKGDYEIPDLQISEERYHLGVRKGEKGLLELVNTTIRDLQQTGDAAKMKEKWFSPREERTPAAYGAIVRRAATPPRFLAVVLNGFLFPKAEVSVFGLDGTYVGPGTVSSVVGDEFYLDVEEAQYNLIQPGFLVGMNMSHEMARKIAAGHKDLLQTVKGDSEKEAARIKVEIEREGSEKQRAAREMDALREQYRLSERSGYYYGSRYGYRY